MAKLSAHGNEVVRLTKGRSPAATPNCDIEEVLAIMEDEAILRKLVWYRAEGRQSDGWKRHERVKREEIPQYIERLRGKGYFNATV